MPRPRHAAGRGCEKRGARLHRQGSTQACVGRAGSTQACVAGVEVLLKLDCRAVGRRAIFVNG